MTLDDLKATLAQPAPPPGLAPAIAALWHDAHGDWDEAHRVAQNIDGENGAWIHAYLHRKEGDLSNAAYWYRRAGRAVESGTLEQEWETIARALLAKV